MALGLTIPPTLLARSLQGGDLAAVLGRLASSYSKVGFTSTDLTRVAASPKCSAMCQIQTSRAHHVCPANFPKADELRLINPAFKVLRSARPW
jgi:hypothetical protein